MFVIIYFLYVFPYKYIHKYIYIYIFLSKGCAHAAGPPKTALPRPVSSIQVPHFNFLKAHPLQEPPLRRDSLLSWTSHKIQSCSEVGANDLILVPMGETIKGGGKQQLST